MRYRSTMVFLFGALMALALTPAAPAQPVTGEIVISNAGGFHGNAVIAMGRYGVITTILPLPAGTVAGIGLNHIGNELLVGVDRMLIGVNEGLVRTLAASLPSAPRDVTVDEDNTWVMAAGPAVLGLNPVSGVRSTIVAGFKNASFITWNGTNGSLMVVDRGDNRIYAIARDHTKRVVATVPNVRCLEWNSYTGDFFVAATNVLLNMTQNGAITTLETNKPGLKSPTDMFLRSDRVLLVAQGNTSPTGVYAYDGATGRFNRPYLEATSPSTGINPAGITVQHYRELWPVKTAVRVGSWADFLVNFPPFKGKTFVGALSFGHAPGIPVGNYRLHLNLDPLFLASLQTPSLFKNTCTLGRHGTGRVTLMVPNLSALVGLRLFLGGVVLDASAKAGIGEATNALGVTLQR